MVLKYFEVFGIVLMKIVIVGGFGFGKIIFVGVVLEIMLLCIEVMVIDVFVGVDMLEVIFDKWSIMVVMDFGCIILGEDLVFYLFGILG